MAKIFFKPGEVTAHKLSNGHVALVLPPNAAQCVLDITAVIGGSPGNTRRRYTARISEALQRIGMDWRRPGHDTSTHHADMESCGDTKNFTIYFTARDDLSDDDCLTQTEIECRGNIARFK